MNSKPHSFTRPRQRAVATAASAITAGAVGFAAAAHADVADSYLGIAYNSKTMALRLFTGVRYQVYDLSPDAHFGHIFGVPTIASAERAMFLAEMPRLDVDLALRRQ